MNLRQLLGLDHHEPARLPDNRHDWPHRWWARFFYIYAEFVLSEPVTKEQYYRDAYAKHAESIARAEHASGRAA